MKLLYPAVPHNVLAPRAMRRTGTYRAGNGRTRAAAAAARSSIAALEAQRAILGDAVVGAAVAALRAQLAALQPARQQIHDDADAERRVVTVMFADVSGFTTLAESAAITP